MINNIMTKYIINLADELIIWHSFYFYKFQVNVWKQKKYFMTSAAKHPTQITSFSSLWTLN